MTNIQTTVIADNIARVQERIAQAAERSQRSATEITLVAVTKYHGPEVAQAVAEAGCLHLGENRPQELWKKADALSDYPIRWHQIGHMQRNKVKRTAPLLHCIHSIDSLRLWESLHEAATQQPLQGLLEVNISGDDSKHGFRPEEMEEACGHLSNYPQVKITGLMTMAALDGDLSVARADFQRLRELRDRLNKHLPPEQRLYDLSMGMSRDFEVAIEEGATLVRVGSVLYEGI